MQTISVATEVPSFRMVVAPMCTAPTLLISIATSTKYPKSTPGGRLLAYLSVLCCVTHICMSLCFHPPTTRSCREGGHPWQGGGGLAYKGTVGKQTL